MRRIRWRLGIREVCTRLIRAVWPLRPARRVIAALVLVVAGLPLVDVLVVVQEDVRVASRVVVVEEEWEELVVAVVEEEQLAAAVVVEEEAVVVVVEEADVRG